MIGRIIIFVLFAAIAITFVAIPFFVELTLLERIPIFFMVVFNSYWAGYYGADVRNEWKERKRERNEKQFAWYYNMGLRESAHIKEPEYPTQYWELVMRGVLR